MKQFKMKQSYNYLLAVMAVFIISSCKKLDNYDAPSETLTGRIIDSSTGQPIQLEPNSTNIRIEDLSWGEKVGTTVIPQDLLVKSDGTFNNTKLFAGTYNVYPFNGPFVPHYSTDANSPIDARKKIEVKGGTTTVEFTVDPLLKVEWVGEPVIEVDKKVTVSFKFTRGTTNPFYIKDVARADLFISTTPILGNNYRDPNLSNSIVYAGVTGNTALGTTVSLTSKLPLGANRTYYVRVGVRTADNVGLRFNYNAPKAVVVP
ncbi:MAG: hypothetical protein JWN56_3016 [Sphingobacteriales bacterium]|nr:hypothetical protein [Sphingobacteriales bacterium]